MHHSHGALVAGVLVAWAAGTSIAAELARAEPCGTIEVVAALDGPMPTGVAVSRTGRIFINYPRWGDPVEFTVAELSEGKTHAYPDAEINQLQPEQAADHFISVQSVVIDSNDRLWILDTGRPPNQLPVVGGPKLVGVDLNTNKVFKKILFPPNVALPTTYLNDIRFSLHRGPEGAAFISDSSPDGANGIIVVNLASGKSWRRLHDHPSTKAEKNFLPIVEGRPLMGRAPGRVPAYMTVGADGIALPLDGKLLYYCPLSGRGLFSVPIGALLDEQASDEDVGHTVIAYGQRGFASDGLEADAQGRLYFTDYEHNAILRRDLEGHYETIAADDRILWPDTLALAADGYLYFTANQLHRQASFHEGHDLRVPPYALFRVRVAEVTSTTQPRQTLTMPKAEGRPGVTDNDVKSFVYEWFALFDHQADESRFLPRLGTVNLTMTLPETTLHSQADFGRWYRGILERIKTNSHDVRDLRVTKRADGGYDVELTVRWQATTFAGESIDQTFRQNWEIAIPPDGRLVISRYVVASDKER